jgi:hypothetical protein
VGSLVTPLSVQDVQLSTIRCNILKLRFEVVFARQGRACVSSTCMHMVPAEGWALQHCWRMYWSSLGKIMHVDRDPLT